jgi:hypothetical protein
MCELGSYSLEEAAAITGLDLEALVEELAQIESQSAYPVIMQGRVLDSAVKRLLGDRPTPLEKFLRPGVNA